MAVVSKTRGTTKIHLRICHVSIVIDVETAIFWRYYIYCSPISMLQTGIDSRRSEGGTKSALDLTMPILCGPRSDLPHTAVTTDETRHGCSLKLGI